MSAIAFALLSDETDYTVKPAELEWPQLVELLTTHERRATKSGTAWVPAIYTGTQRGNQFVKAVTLASFDCDGVPFGPGETIPLHPKTGLPLKQRSMTPEEWGAMLARVDASGYAAVVHSSFSYNPDKPKGRIVFRTTRAMLPGEWPIVRDYLDSTLRLNADRSTKDLTRLYYLPAAPEGAPVFAATTDGTNSVDVDEIVKGHRVEVLSAAIEVNANARAAAALEAARKLNDEPVDLDGLRRMLNGAIGKNAQLLKDAVKGKAIANEGERDNTLNMLCAAARFAVPSTTPSAALVEIFRESLQKIPRSGSEDWIGEAYNKLERHQERRILNDAARQAQHDEQFARLRAEAARSALVPPKPRTQAHGADMDTPGSTDQRAEEAIQILQDVGPYSDEQLAEWAQDQACVDVLDFKRRWIITRLNAHYVWVEGRYLPPVPRENLEFSIQRDLARAPIELTQLDAKGNLRMRDMRTILHECSTVARNTQADLALQRSYYEPHTQTFHEAVTPLRHLEARFHPEVHQWLELLDPSHKLLDWVASVARLDRQLCAIYLDGPKSVGKTLLASSLARLWTTGGPSSLARILEGFNESIISCPLILADEGLPQRKGITAEIRNLIGTTSRTLNRKFLPMTSLNGALRLIIAGNNDRLMETGEELSANDLEAVASRIYYLKANQEPADYLHSIGGPPKVQSWVNQDVVAEHALFLRNTRKVNESARFLVEGDTSAFHRQLAMGSGVGSTVSEWLVRYLADPNPTTNGLVQVGNNELWVNTEAMAKEANWIRYVPSNKVPTAAQITRALRGIGKSTATVPINGHNVTFHVIDPDLILTFVSRLQIGDVSAIRKKFAVANPIITAHQLTVGA